MKRNNPNNINNAPTTERAVFILILRALLQKTFQKMFLLIIRKINKELRVQMKSFSTTCVFPCGKCFFFDRGHTSTYFVGFHESTYYFRFFKSLGIDLALSAVAGSFVGSYKMLIFSHCRDMDNRIQDVASPNS